MRVHPDAELATDPSPDPREAQSAIREAPAPARRAGARRSGSHRARDDLARTPDAARDDAGAILRSCPAAQAAPPPAAVRKRAGDAGAGLLASRRLMTASKTPASDLQTLDAATVNAR